MARQSRPADPIAETTAAYQDVLARIETLKTAMEATSAERAAMLGNKAQMITAGQWEALAALDARLVDLDVAARSQEAVLPGLYAERDEALAAMQRAKAVPHLQNMRVIFEDVKAAAQALVAANARAEIAFAAAVDEVGRIAEVAIPRVGFGIPPTFYAVETWVAAVEADFKARGA